MSKRSTIVICGLAAAFMATEPVMHAHATADGTPFDQKCEDQLKDLIKKHDLSVYGDTRYHPWTRHCSYRYLDNKTNDPSASLDDRIKTFRWMPAFN